MYGFWTFKSYQKVYGICLHPGDFGTFPVIPISNAFINFYLPCVNHQILRRWFDQLSFKIRAVERAWKAWQFHGARTRKRGPKITKTKEKHDNQKKFSYFGPQICKLRGPQNSQALGWPNQSIQRWTCKRGGARKHCFHGARPGSPRPCLR
jgi:hypothetical protein